MLFAQKNVVLRDDFSFQRGCGHAKFFSRATNDGPGLQEDNPILCRDVIGMDRDMVTGDLSFEDTHFSDLLSVIALIFGEVRSGLEYGPAGRLFLAAILLSKDTAYSARRMYPEPDLSTVAVNDSPLI
jgi:hypothetical protein